MSINLITYPSDVPVSIDDWQNNIKLHDAVLLQQEDPWRIDYDNDEVMQGSVFQIQGAIYQADSDTEITGSASDYVKITPVGETASAAYVANLTGVSWNNVYKGYYDGSGNLHVFDEIKAILAGAISSTKTKIGRAYQTIVAADNIFSGDNTFTGDNTYSGENTFSAENTFSGNNTFSGTNTFDDVVIFAEKPTFTKGFSITNSLSGANKTENTVFDTLKNYVPNTGDKLALFGGFAYDDGFPDGTRRIAVVSHCERINTTTIRFYYIILDMNLRDYSDSEARLETTDAVDGSYDDFYFATTYIQIAW